MDTHQDMNSLPSVTQSSVPKFKPSKWETVDPEVVEAQGNSFGQLFPLNF